MRLEIPARYRHFQDVLVRYPRWDLSQVDMVDPREGTVLAHLFPLDRTANADGRRAIIDPGGMKFVWNSKGNHMLFNLIEDPGENYNLLRRIPKQADVLNNRMTNDLVGLPPPGPQAAGGQVDEETMKALKSMGYIQ